MANQHTVKPGIPAALSNYVRRRKSDVTPAALFLELLELRLDRGHLRIDAQRLLAGCGAELAVLHGELKTWFEARGLSARVSLSDESDYAVSFVVVEQWQRPA